jgi:hypothetical protein
MIGKHKIMNNTEPVSPGVVIPTDSGKVFFILKNDGKIKLRMMTKAWPPKYI